MDKETNIADKYKELVKIFEKQMLEENMSLWFFDIYLPDLFARKFIIDIIKMSIKITKNFIGNEDK